MHNSKANDLRKLIIDCLIIITLVLVIVIALNYLYKKISRNDEYNAMPNSLSYLNTGTSHGKQSFDWSTVSDKGFNFGMDAQSFFYDQSLLDQYHDRIEKDAVVFIPVSFFSFWFDEMENPQTFTAKNKRYIQILDINHMRFINDKDRRKALLQQKIPVLFAIDDFLQEVVDTNPNKPSQFLTIEQIAEKRVASQCNDILDNGNVLPINTNAVNQLRSLIEYCKSLGTRIVLVTTPFLDYYNKYWPNQVLDIFYTEINTIADEYGIPYFDYSHDQRFTYNQTLFTENDTDHLNSTGAQLFTRIVVEDWTVYNNEHSTFK